jgi:hypothetical protein
VDPVGSAQTVQLLCGRVETHPLLPAPLHIAWSLVQ